ncbi:MAG: alkaline phosphatase [Balneolaceae bacterium]
MISTKQMRKKATQTLSISTTMKKYILPTLLIFFTYTPFALAQDAEYTNPTETIEVAESQDTPDLLPLVDSDRIKNVVLIVGDGMGIAQITTGQYALVGPGGLLQMQRMPVTGFVNTYSGDNLITDSAAGATALSCGLKTYNGAIGVDMNVTPCKTILELAAEKGLSTGLVSTSSITHATPASFASHVERRNMQDKIAAQFLDSKVDVFLGGGVKFFHPETRKDKQDLIGKFREKGYQVLLNENDLAKTSSDRLLGLFADNGMERVGGEPSSAKMAEKALEVLSKNDKGFFLMLEGSQVDWAGHDNDVDSLVNEMRDFDEAIKSILDFAQQDGETLVVLTADHETGGMNLQKQQENGEKLEITWSTDYHTGTPVPLLAYGPGALEFMGWRDNTYIGQKLTELLGIGELPVLIDNSSL